MSIANAIFFRTPGVSCVEINELSITLSQYGNHREFNTFSPRTTLELLRALSTPASIPQLKDRLKKISHKALTVKEISAELHRLLAAGLVLTVERPRAQSKATSQTLQTQARQTRTPQTQTRQTQARQTPTHHRLTGLKFFASIVGTNQHVLERISAIQKSRILIIDALNLGGTLKTQLESVGYEHVSIQSTGGTDELAAKAKFDHDLILVLVRPEHEFYLTKLNQKFAKLKKPWLLVMVDEYGGLLGPRLGVKGGPCFTCLIEKRSAQYGVFNLNEPVSDIHEMGSNDASTDLVSPVTGGFFSLVTVEITKILSQFVWAKTTDGFYAFDFFNFRMSYNHVQPSANCLTCFPRVSQRSVKK